ncbi:MAG: PIG-L deacetylase family protein [Myxococcota bacterium]
MAIPVPDLLEARNLLCVQPHYDDNDIAAGGTLARLHALGARITYVTVTDDLVGVLDPELSDEAATARLRAEQAEAAQHVGVDEQVWLGYPDAGRFELLDLRDDLIRVMRRVRPDFVLSCDPWLPYEAHHDHVRCGLATAQAISLQGLRRLRLDPEPPFEPHAITALALYWTHAPNATLDVSGHRDAKHRALDCYRAQFRDEELALLHRALEQRERAFARGLPYSHAEPFKVLRPFQLHCDPGAWRA